MPSDHEYDIAIVGAGPVGMVLAALLAADGLTVVMLEREAEIGHRPRARHLDGEAIRVLQAAGVAEEAVAPMHRFRGLRLVDADRRTLFEHRVDTVHPGPQGWIDDMQMFQPVLLETLATKLSGADGRVDIRTSEEAVAIDQDPDGVRIETTAEGRHRSVSAAYAVGCDGAASWVRGAIGARFETLGPSHPYLVIDATPLEESFELPEPIFSTNVCDPARPHYVSPGEGVVPMRFEFMVLPGDDPEELSSAAGIERLTSPYIRGGRVRFDRAAIYTFHSLLVDDWRVGRVFLAGDSAHVQPPFMGQGLCSGIRDAANLAWKLSFVRHGLSDPAVLDTYASERRAHVKAWIDEANRIGAIVMTTDPEVAAQRNARILAGDAHELRPLQPMLGPGLHGDADAPAGTLSPQPFLPDGRRLDDLVGKRFLLVARARLLATADGDLRRRIDAQERIFFLDGDSAPGQELLDHYGGNAVVIRPDRYVLGVAGDGEELDRLLGLTLAAFSSTVGTPG